MADVIYAKLEQLHQMACSIGMVLKAMQAQVKAIDERGGEDNVLEKILVNGTQLFPDREKAVRMTIPIKISDLDNDKKFQENVIEQVLLNGTKMPVDSQKRVSITIPTGTNNLVNDAGYQTNADVLAAIRANAYVHPSHTAYGSGLYKIVVDNLGHVTSAAKAVKSDITSLGIPGQDTVYTHPGYTGHGLGLYKLAVDGQGHVSSVAGITKGDITALGIPGQDTNSWRGIQNNLSSDSTSDSLSAAMGKALNTSLNDAITRIATCEQKIKAIGGVTEVLLGTVVSPAIKGDTLYKGATHTMATFGSEVAFVKIDTVGKLLRGSSSVKQLWSVYDDPGSYYHYLYVRWDFTTDGRVTATCDRELTDNYAWHANTLKVNIDYYKYAA